MTATLPGVPVTGSASLLARLHGLRGGAAAFTTSWFADPAQTERWSAKGVLSLLSYPGCALVLRRDHDFYHVYHSAVDTAALADALAAAGRALPTEVLVADLVDRPAGIAPIADVYAAAGFSRYKALVRMSRTSDPAVVEPPPVEPAELATPADVPAVSAFFERLLDRYAEQIPDPQELEQLAANGSVLVVRSGTGLGGVLVYEIHGQSAILRYWWVSEACRGAGVGARLIRSMFPLTRGTRRIVLWVIEGNVNAIAKYEHYGFRREGLVDQLMIRPRNESQ